MDISGAYRGLRDAFNLGVTRDLAWRRDQIAAIDRMIVENEQLFLDALKKDLNKPKFESLSAEIQAVRVACKMALDNLEKWTAERHLKRVDLATFACPTTVKYVPYGVCFVIGTWNFPINLTILPLINAISAGNAVFVKPSEVTPTCSALMTKLGNAYLSKRGGVVFMEGDKDLVQTLMNENRVDFVFYTGGPVGGKAVAKLCAEKLIPSVLELGGKNPCIVDNLASQEISVNDIARRLLWTKALNSGQICLSVDYCIFRSVEDRDRVIAEMKKVAAEWFPDGLDADYPDYCHIVHAGHFKHIMRFLESKPSGKVQKLVDAAANEEKLFFPPTVILHDTPEEMSDHEVFGAVMNCLVIEDLDEAMAFITERPVALSSYIFSGNKANVDKFLDVVNSGSVAVNDCMRQVFNDTLPFGGCGESGWGQYHGHYGFEAFSHRKSVLRQKSNAHALAVTEPPYYQWKAEMVKCVTTFSFAAFFSMLHLLFFDRKKLCR